MTNDERFLHARELMENPYFALVLKECEEAILSNIRKASLNTVSADVKDTDRQALDDIIRLQTVLSLAKAFRKPITDKETEDRLKEEKEQRIVTDRKRQTKR